MNEDRKFTLELEGKTFNFEINSDNFVWLVSATNPNMRDNKGQTRPARNKEEAKTNKF